MRAPWKQMAVPPPQTGTQADVTAHSGDTLCNSGIRTFMYITRWRPVSPWAPLFTDASRHHATNGVASTELLRVLRRPNPGCASSRVERLASRCGGTLRSHRRVFAAHPAPVVRAELMWLTGAHMLLFEGQADSRRFSMQDAFSVCHCNRVVCTDWSAITTHTPMCVMSEQMMSHVALD